MYLLIEKIFLMLKEIYVMKIEKMKNYLEIILMSILKICHLKRRKISIFLLLIF